MTNITKEILHIDPAKIANCCGHTVDIDLAIGYLQDENKTPVVTLTTELINDDSQRYRVRYIDGTMVPHHILAQGRYSNNMIADIILSTNKEYILVSKVLYDFLWYQGTRDPRLIYQYGGSHNTRTTNFIQYNENHLIQAIEFVSPTNLNVAIEFVR